MTMTAIVWVGMIFAAIIAGLWLIYRHTGVRLVRVMAAWFGVISVIFMIAVLISGVSSQ